MTPIKLLSTSSILIASVLLSGCGSDNDNNALPVYDTLDAYFITGLNYSDIVSADLDADGDMDLVQCGYDRENQTSHTQIYLNNLGTFELLSTPLDTNNDGEGDTSLYALEYECALDIADMDNDGDIDIVGTGAGPAPDYGVFTHVFENQGNNIFTTKTDWVRNSDETLSDLLGTNQGFVTFTDINNDQHLEIMLSASTDQDNLSKLYLNNADGTFSVINNPVDGTSVLLNKNNGTHAWGDFNGDKFQDLIILGGQGDASTYLYLNNKNNTFSKVGNPVNGTAEFPGLYSGPVSWGDIDGDNDLDILISAREGSGNNPHTLIYENLGSDNAFQFSLVATPIDTDGDNIGDSMFTEYSLSEMFLADIDGKNELDIILIGEDMANDTNATSIYLNTGDKSYIRLENPVDTDNDGSGDAQFEAVYYAGATVADLDNDGDMDLIYNGQNNDFTLALTLVYENIDGTTFVNVSESNQPL